MEYFWGIPIVFMAKPVFIYKMKEENNNETLDSKITIRIPESMHKELIDLCLTNEITISDLLRGLADKALDELWRIDE